MAFPTKLAIAPFNPNPKETKKKKVRYPIAIPACDSVDNLPAK